MKTVSDAKQASTPRRAPLFSRAQATGALLLLALLWLVVLLRLFLLRRA